MKIRLPAGVAFACTACALVGLCGLASPAADFVNQVAVIWWPIGLLAASVTVRSSPRSAVAMVALLAIYAGLMIAPEISARMSERPQASGQGTLKLIQFNIFKDNDDPQATAEWIAAQKADILTISEASGNGLEVMRRLKTLYPYQVTCLEANFCSTMIASKLAPIAVEHLGTGDPENDQGLSAVEASFAKDGQAFTVISVHLIRPWPYHDQARYVALLRSAVRRAGAERTIVAGDFNTPASTFAMTRLDRAMGLRRITHQLPTWPARLPGGWTWRLPLLGIDHIYIGGAWRLVSVRTGPSEGSDHRPVIAALVLSGAADSSTGTPSLISSMKR